MGTEKNAYSSPNKLTKYQQTMQGNSFYASEVQSEIDQYTGTIVHFWFSKLVLGMSHIFKFLKLLFQYFNHFPWKSCV